MASATGIPQHVPDAGDDSEPLLGRPGDATQPDDAPIARNFIMGTAVLAEAASILLVASVWASVFLNKPPALFSVHPLAQSLGLAILIQGILILQPTHTGAQKKVGARVHAGLNAAALVCFVVGVGAIEANKVQGGLAHFHSVHAYLGVIASVWQLLQVLVGLTMWAAPALYGGDANARSVWKYHRASGYGLLLLYAATVLSATQTDFVIAALGLKLWAMIVIVVLLVLGVFPRVKKHKLGL